MNINNDISEQFIKNLVDDFINQVKTQIESRVYQDVTRAMSDFDVKAELHQQIVDSVGSAITTYHWPNTVPSNTYNEDSVVKGIVAEFKSRTHQFLDTVARAVQEDLEIQVRDKLYDINFVNIVQQQTSRIAEEKINSFKFPEASIPGTSVSSIGLKVKADNIEPGIIRNFESVGIQDRASQCQVTILDDATVIENKLITNNFEVAGQVNFRGNVNTEFVDRLVSQTVSVIENQYGDGTFDQYCNRVFEKIKSEGLDSSYVTVNGSALVENQTLSLTVVNSNLQRVGALKELQVIGETLLDESLYVSNKRVGINTIEPERVLDIWDQEVQIVAGKRSKDVGYIGTSRNQTLIIGAANKDQLVVNPDGSVTVGQLNLGRVRHSSSPWQPTDNRPMGQIVWNEQPQIGAPIGWVSLGGARWARFGTISE